MKTIDPTAIFNALQGNWRLDRQIAGYGTMVGTAAFKPVAGQQLHYHEDVKVTLENGQLLDSFQDYYYRLHDGTIEIDFFQDNRLFQRLEFQASASWPLEATGDHLCNQDRYQGRYRFESPDRFSITMAVQGPQKNHRIETQFTRLAL